MKKSKKIISLIMSVTMLLQFTPIDKAMIANAYEVNVNFAKGADVGWLPQMEASKFVFKDDNGKPEDCLKILKDHGVDSIRLRTWVNPSNDPQSGHCSTQETVDMAVRAKSMGFRIMLDFHYSDSWADPSKQNIPSAWQNDNLEQMKTHLFDYTHDVMTKLKDAGVTPEWVQVGNEINPGMLLPMGSFSTPSNLAQLINSGYEAVKAVSPTSKVIIHRANGYDNASFRNFFDALKENDTKYDVIGVSYYPENDYTSSIDALGNNLNDMASRYGKEVMVVEVGGDCSVDEVNVHNMVVAVQNKVLAVPNGKGIGVFYWEPEGAKSWSGYSMSAWNGTDGKATDGQPTKTLDAFLPGEVELNPNPVTGIVLDKSSVSLEVGEAVTLKATLSPSNSTYKGVIFSSSNESIAKVNPTTGIVAGITPGSATITATSYDQHKTATCEVTVIPSSNLIKNPGFELNKENWTVSGNAASVTIENDSHKGDKALHYYNADFEVSQTITGLENGWYKLSAWTSGGGGEKLSEIFAVNSDGQRSSQTFTNTGWRIWNEVIINNIKVTDGKITIGANVKMNDNGGQWGNIDDFVLIKNEDTSLKDLQVNGGTVKNFDPSVTSYDIALPSGTTVVPTVTAAALYTSATVNVTPAVALPGHTTITVTNGSSTKTYTINFTVQTDNPIKNPGFESSFDNWTISNWDSINLSNDKHSGLKALGYWKATPFELTASQKITGLKNGVYRLSAWSQGAADSYTNQLFVDNSKGTRRAVNIKNTGWAVWSQAVINDIIVTDGTLTIGAYLNAPAGYWGSYDDFELMQTSTEIPKNADAALNGITVDGKAIDNFAAETTEYTVTLPYGTANVPVVAATANDSKAKVLVTQASSVNGNATIVVTAEDGKTTRTFTVKFDVAKGTDVAKNTDAALKGITVDGKAVDNFTAGTTKYTVTLPYGTTNVPVVAATTNDSKAKVLVTQAGSVTGNATIVVTAEDGKTVKTYVVKFLVANEDKHIFSVSNEQDLLAKVMANKEAQIVYTSKGNAVDTKVFLLAKTNNNIIEIAKDNVTFKFNDPAVLNTIVNSGLTSLELKVEPLNSDNVKNEVTKNNANILAGYSFSNNLIDGKFGGNLGLDLNLGAANAGKTVYLYYVDKNNQFNKIGSVAVNSNGMASFVVTHFSDYIIVDKELALNSSNENKNLVISQLPKTGSIGFGNVIALGFTIFVAGIILSRKRKNIVKR